MSSRRPPLAEGLERQQADQPLALALEDYPVVVPARQEFAREGELFQLQRAHVGPAVHHSLSEPIGLPHVDDYLGREDQVIARRTDELEPELPKAPQRRPKVSG